jgi:hypothetical protein
MHEVIEGEVQEPVASLAVRPAQAVEVWTPQFAVAVDEMIEKVEQKHRFYKSVMKVDQHYGVIPGTTQKPTLLKPGAELLLSSMGLYAELSDEMPPVVDYDGSQEGHGEPLIRYHQVCRIYRQVGPTELERVKIAQSSGTCSSREKKYRYRESKRVCPQCGAETIIKGKKEYGGGWLCFKKQGGCGAKFEDDDRQITGQEVGKVSNPELADVENTILKMAQKRALVGATLIATGCSDIFTQDQEQDNPSEEEAVFNKAEWNKQDNRRFVEENGYSKKSHYATGGLRADVLKRDNFSPETASEPKGAPISIKARAMLNALIDDQVLAPFEVQEVVAKELGDGRCMVWQIETDEEARDVYAALRDAKKRAATEIPLA